MILGDYEPLTDHYGEELREQVYSGKGLLSSLYLKQGQCLEHDHDDEDDPLFGLTYKEELSGSVHQINIPQGSLSGAVSFGAKGDALRVDVDDPAQIMGWIEWQKGYQWRPSPKEYPGIVENQYGKGKTLFFAFDIGLTLDDENFTILSTILKNSLFYIHTPADTDAFSPYRFVPVMLTLKSLGGAFDLRVRETYPEELKLYNPATGHWVTDRPWVFDIHLNADETKTILYDALTPDKPGTYTLQTEVGYLENGVYHFYQELSKDIVVGKDTIKMVGDIIEKLNALSVSRHDELSLNNAILHMERVQNRRVTTIKDIEQNIEDILKAIDSLISITSTDISETRLLIDGLIEVWETKWYFYR
jgi:hypothetical protein